MGSATAVEYEIGVGLECQDTGICSRLRLAFVIMPDHIHWLFALQNECSLADVMQSVKGQSARKIQQIRRERGEIAAKQALWQEGYHDHALRKEEDVQKMARYIVANPLRAGIVSKIADYSLWDAIWL